eukprot:s2754_g13.t1
MLLWAGLFTTPQGLASRKRSAHNVGALEGHLIDGAICPCCLKFLWSRGKIFQHLAYFPRKGQVNHCFQELQKRGFHVLDEMPSGQPRQPAGLHRTEALQALGPMPAPFDNRSQEIATVKARLQQTEDALVIDADAQLDQAEAYQQHICDQLTSRIYAWFQDFCASGNDADCISCLPDSWLEAVGEVPQDYDTWLEAVYYIHWVEHFLPDVLAGFLDGEAEKLVDDAFANLIYDFPPMQLLAEVAFLGPEAPTFGISANHFIPTSHATLCHSQ